CHDGPGILTGCYQKCHRHVSPAIEETIHPDIRTAPHRLTPTSTVTAPSAEPADVFPFGYDIGNSRRAQRERTQNASKRNAKAQRTPQRNTKDGGRKERGAGTEGRYGTY
ncbi:hypothetical protein BDB00DRAFT_931432, partial [Zychaea mexicana]|uniref:uncharacterized protein n=1 Tax=Zychaea mexicana TaxID=64656 RepID=UPI0022FDF2B8